MGSGARSATGLTTYKVVRQTMPEFSDTSQITIKIILKDVQKEGTGSYILPKPYLNLLFGTNGS